MRRVLLLLLLCSFLASCEKRYEDGPCLSFIKPENRITGRWQLSSFLMDGTEQAPALNDTLPVYDFSFLRNSDNALFVSLIDSGDRVWAESLIRYDDRVIYLTFGLTVVEGYDYYIEKVFQALPALSVENTWQITRLKRKEMWMKTEHAGVIHELRFKLLFDYDNH
jgi:hypothetical protein